MRSTFILRSVTLLSLVAASCSKSEQAAPGASQGNEAAPSSVGTTMPKPTDAQILGILATVDNGEIQQAQVARNRASDPRVKDFANHMIEQHTNAKQKASEFASQNNLTPERSTIAEQLDKKGKEVGDALMHATAAAFDTTYIKDQVQQHQEVLDLMREQLAPAASGNLKAQLPAIQSMVQSHLETAREILPTLGATGKQPSTAE